MPDFLIFTEGANELLANGLPATCTFEPNGQGCPDDGNVCTNEACNGSGTCVHTNNTASCTDGLFCTGTDTCSG